MVVQRGDFYIGFSILIPLLRDEQPIDKIR